MRAGMATIRHIESAEPRVIDSLCTLLIDAVHDGASVGFLAPLSRETALQYWQQALASAGDGWSSGSRNPAERSSVRCNSVSARRKTAGIARNCRSCWCCAAIAGSPAESVYRHLGWCKTGEIPEFAAMQDGELRATAYYYKHCPPSFLPVIAARPEMRDKMP